MKGSFPEFAKKMALESQELILKYYRRLDLDIIQKSNDTPVTRADREAEQLMREMITREFPSHGIIGEEYGPHQADAEFVWTLDPIDGTVTFTHGCPLFGTLICLQQAGRPIMGILNLPALGQLFVGDGEKATCNGKEVRLRKTASLADATLLTTDVTNIEKYQSLQRFENLRNKCKTMRTWGDCYGYALLAGGWADIMCDPIMNPWDILALIPIIEGAGGVISDWQGNSAVSGSSTVAAPKALHAQVIEILNAG